MFSVTRYILYLLYVFGYHSLYIFDISLIRITVVQAIKELNIKTKNWKELLTDEPFTRADIITIQVNFHFAIFGLGWNLEVVHIQDYKLNN